MDGSPNVLDRAHTFIDSEGGEEQENDKRGNAGEIGEFEAGEESVVIAAAFRHKNLLCSRPLIEDPVAESFVFRPYLRDILLASNTPPGGVG
jgi:hypothetical protein